MYSTKILHTLHDGSTLRVISAKELIQIPVWHGNRIMDMAHVKRIKEAIGNNINKLDFGFRIVTYIENDACGHQLKTSCIIDGQHRHRVLYDYFHTELCVPDFPVVILEKNVSDESEIITYFKELNNQKPIEWKSDPNMLANEYIKELSSAFNKKKEVLIRPKATKRPYLSSEDLRACLVKYHYLLKESKEEIKAFVQRVVQYNTEQLSGLLGIYTKKADEEIVKKAESHKFMLAVDPKLPWVKGCL